MNRARLVAAVGIGLLALAGNLPAATLPVDSQDVPALKPKIEAFLTTQLTAVSGVDVVAAKNARDAIIAEVSATIPTAPKPGGVFTDAYSDELNKQLLTLLQSQDLRVRLNAAIIASKVSERTNSAKLAPVVLKTLSDSSTAVVRWGVHACQFVLPQLLTSPQPGAVALLPAMVKAVSAHITDGTLVEAAYSTLGTPPVGTTGWGSALPQIVGAMQEIFEKRLDLYQKNIAPMPTIEGVATTFLVSRAVWNMPNGTAAQHKTMDLVTRLINNASQRGPAAGINDRTELVYLVRNLASGLQVVGGYISDANLATAGKQLATVNTGNAATWKALSDGAVQAVQKIPAFKDIVIAAPLPASMPTTSEVQSTPTAITPTP